MELSLFAISCVSAAFPLTHSLAFPLTPRKPQVKVPVGAGVWSRSGQPHCCAEMEHEPVPLPVVGPCPWWVPVTGVSPHCWLLSSSSEHEILVSCAAAITPCKATSWHRQAVWQWICGGQAFGLWQCICQWTGSQTLAVDLCMDR